VNASGFFIYLCSITKSQYTMAKPIIDFKEFAKAIFDRNLLKPMLSERYIDIIEDRIINEMTISEIANKFEISETRATQMYRKAIDRVSKANWVKLEMSLIFEKQQEIISKDLQLNAYAKELARIESEESKFSSTLRLADIELENVDMSVRLYNCLKAAKCSTLQDVVLKGRHEIKKLRNVGKGTMVELETILKQYDVDF